MSRFVVGIDLGTTHCVVAENVLGGTSVQLFEIPQLISPGEVGGRALLPSFMYLPAAGEMPEGSLRLPWDDVDPPHIVGELARRMGAKVPGRLVASAKSWICHGGVNRRAPILPWSAPDSEPHVSPFAAQVAYLSHLRAAWNAAHGGLELADQEVVVTVPASFDDGARELTLEAAHQAGLGEARLIEEPQAAFYDYLHEHEDHLAEALGDARLVLVVDVGGGTTDLTLLKVLPPEDDGQPRLERIAVGGHLMLGGDNMDAALAHHVLQKGGIERRLDPTEWSALVQATRDAKERLLGPNPPAETTVSVQQRGSRLIGGTRSVTLTPEDVRQVLLDGFLPFTDPTETTERTGRPGLTTLGLPYATDPALPRHLCSFLRKHGAAALEAGAQVQGGLPQPDLLLLNGGVFNAPVMMDRLAQVMGRWYGRDALALLQHTSLDTAVARGAARYALARRGVGQLIAGGTARAYYIGVEGPSGERQAFCVAPRGMSEGTSVSVSNRPLDLVLDKQVSFPLYAYTGDRVDAAGTVVKVTDELEPLPALETVIRSRGQQLQVTSGAEGERTAAVTLSSTLAESGALELYLVTLELPPRRWRLELALRADEAEGGADKAEEAAPSDEPLPPHTADAIRMIERVFAKGKPEAAAAKSLRRDLEEKLGPRGGWSGALCRALFDSLINSVDGRRRSPEHELNWLRLAGWCLRPGWGASGDPTRMRRLWTVHQEGLVHRSKLNWAEWWILWRRVAAGLEAQQQGELLQNVQPWLDPQAEVPRGPKAHGKNEMLQLLGALERVPRAAKEQAGGWFLAASDKATSWWPLGRLGARVPFHGAARDVVEPAVAARWLERLLPLDWSKSEGAAFAATLLAQVSGEAQRDVDPELRRQVLTKLVDMDAPAPWREMVSRPTQLREGDMKRVFGDTLPAGLRLSG